MTEWILILTSLLLVSPLILFSTSMNQKTSWYILAGSISIIMISVVHIYQTQENSLATIKSLLGIYVSCMVLNIDNIISYILVAESVEATDEERNRAINIAILSAIFFRETLIFIGMLFAQQSKWIFKLTTICLSIYVWRTLCNKSSKQNDNKNEPGSSTIRFSKIVLLTIFAECLFSFDSTSMIIASTTNPEIAHTANLAAMCCLKPITTAIQSNYSNRSNLNDKIWLPLVFVLTKTILWG